MKTASDCGQCLLTFLPRSCYDKESPQEPELGLHRTHGWRLLSTVWCGQRILSSNAGLRAAAHATKLHNPSPLLATLLSIPL